MTTYAHTRSDRTDTTVSEVAVRQGSDGSSNEGAAVRRFKVYRPQAKILAVWRTGERDKGNPVYAIEWEVKEES